MATLSLKIGVLEANVTKTMQFEPSTIVYDACKIIRDVVPTANPGNPSDYGLFLSDDDPKKGVWLEQGRSLEYYLLRNGDLLEYKKKHRILKVRTLDGVLKTLQVDDSHTIGSLMITICARMGITNHEEYSLVRDLPDEEKEKTLTLKRDKSIAKDQKRLEEMKKKLHTDDEMNWLDHSKTLREQDIEQKEVLLLRRKFFYSDQNVDGRDPVQLNLLYVQSRDAILNGTHPVSVAEAITFAGIQCQVQFGDHVDNKHKAGLLDLKEFLPKEYVKVKAIEKKIWMEHKEQKGLAEVEAKVKYTQSARSLKTYGITFFLVKEKMKGKNKLVPRLLGITKESVVRVDEKTKEIMKVWPLTTVRRWAASPNSFTLDFGDYQDQYYSVQTIEGEQISQLIAGYIDIILRRRKAKDHLGIEGDDNSMMYEENVQAGQATIIQHGSSNLKHPSAGSVSMPGLLRDGYQGENKIAVGHLQRGQVSHQANQARSGAHGVHGASGTLGEWSGRGSRTSATISNAGYYDEFDGGQGGQGKENGGLDSPDGGQDSVDGSSFGGVDGVDGLDGRDGGGSGDGGSPSLVQGKMEGTSGQMIQKSELTQAQQALVLTVNHGLNAVNSARDQLDQPADLPNLGDDAAARKWRANQQDLSKQKVGSQLSAMNAATAQLVTLTSQQANDADMDYSTIGAAVEQISSNVGELSREVRMLVVLEEDGARGQSLLDAAKGLIGAMGDLLRAAEPGTTEPRQNLLTAAGKIGEATQEVMTEVGETAGDMDKAFQETLLALAKAVANATASLVLQAKTVATTASDPQAQDQVISSATQCALATSQLVACTKVVAPTINHPACQEQLIEAAKLVAKSVEGIVGSAQQATQDDAALQDLGAAATAVTKALNDLLMHIKKAAQPTQANEQHEEAVDTIINVTDRLFSSVGDAHEMVKSAKQLAQATSTLVSSIRFDAEEQSDSDRQRRLLAAAKQLADATAKLVEAAKGCASSPNDAMQQQMLRSAAEDLRSATNNAASNALKRRLMNRLESSAGQAASAATQLINAANQASKTNGNPQSNQQMLSAAEGLEQQLPALVQALKAAQRQPDHAPAQLALINASQDFIQPSSRLIATGNAAAPTVSDQAAALNLHNAIKHMSNALAELRSSANKASEACQSLEVDSALAQLADLAQDLQGIQAAAQQGQLQPLPGEDAETCAAQLGTTSKTVGSAMAQLLTAAAQGNEDYVGIAARDTVSALKVMVSAVRGVAATSTDQQVQQAMVENASEVVAQSQALLEEAKRAAANPGDPDNQHRLAQVAKAVSSALNNCVNCLPVQRDIDNAMRLITDSSQMLDTAQFPGTGKSYGEVQGDMSASAVGLNQAASDVVASSRTSNTQLASSSTRYSVHYGEFVHTGLTLAGLSQDADTQNQIVGGLKSVSMVSSKLMMAAKSVSADPNAPNAKNMLAQAARAVTESINNLFDICTQAAPGQKECDNAIRQIQMLQGMLDNPNEPVSDLSYFDCLQTVMERSKELGEAMTGISTEATQGGMEAFCSSVRGFSHSVCGLTEAAVQAAYLVGVSDPASEPGRPGVVDQTQFSRANQAIQQACQNLSNPASSQQQVLSAATIVAKHTSSLCNSCRQASSKTANPVAKRHFVQSAKDVANSTATLVKAIKALDSEFTDENRQKCAEAARPLIQAVEELNTFASSPEFASKPAKISAQAEASQEPIVSSGRGTVSGALAMLASAKQLAVAPRDPAAHQTYSQASRDVSEAIKALVQSIKDSAPGQHECDRAIEYLNATLRELDQASMAALSHNLQPQDQCSLKSYQEQMINSAREILDRVDAVRQAAKSEPQNLGHLISTITSYLEPLARSAIGGASRMTNSKQQQNLLDQTKTVAESALQFMYACKEGGGNPKASACHSQMDTAAEDMKDVLQDLLATVEEAASQAGQVSAMIDTITKAIAKTDERESDRLSIVENLSFVDHQTNMVRLAKQIARAAQDMIGKSSTDPGHLGVLAGQLTRDFASLAAASTPAAASCNSTEIGSRIRSTVQDLGTSCVETVTAAGSLQQDPGDQYARDDLLTHAKLVTEKVSYVLAALQAGARGTQACIHAASTVSGIIGDLDTTIMFASAGTLNDEGSESFADQRENILKTAKALVEDTKTLVAGAASNQEQLAQAAQCAVKTITRLADVVKLGAAALGSEQPEAQVLLINAVKDVASALSDLISATKNASGKPVKDPAMLTLKDSAKVMVTNVTSLLKTVKTVEDEAVRGTRALESTIEAIGQEIHTFETTTVGFKQATAEDLIRFAKPITSATAKAVAAGNSGRQEDVISTANMGRKAISDLLSIVRGAAATAETSEIKQRALNAGRQAALTYRELLTALHQVVLRPTPEGKAGLSTESRKVANAVTELVQSAEAIKGSDWVDPEDPTVIAENELLTAANSIEAAAKKLAQLRPRQQTRAVDEDLDFEDQILEAAKSIAAATAALVKSASAAQRELVAQGKVAYTHTRHATDEDGQWSQGLISAARMVAAATHSLCEAANAMVQGQASEEMLIASAKEVAASTAQLLMACKVKADADSQAMQRLQLAGNAVKRATEALVRAAQQAKQQDEEASLTIDKRKVGGIAQELQAQEEILRKEKELEAARNRLMNIRKERYKDRPPEDDDSSSSY